MIATAQATKGASLGARFGAVAEWLRSGLQSRVHRFDSGRRLEFRAKSVAGGGRLAAVRRVAVAAGWIAPRRRPRGRARSRTAAEPGAGALGTDPRAGAGA